MDISKVFQDKRIKKGFIVAGAFGIVILAILTWQNKVNVAQDAIIPLWNVLDRSVQERVELLPKYISFIAANSPESQGIVNTLQGVYQQVKGVSYPPETLNDPDKLQTMSEQQQSVVAALYQMRTQLPPTFLENPNFININSNLEANELQIQFSSDAIKRQVVRYNQLVNNLPQRWVNTLFTHYPSKYFPQVPTLTGIDARPR